ncbi:hypothetical protein MAHJHV59_50480 [Mycobacterium avium subsp. hominissuis]
MGDVLHVTVYILAGLCLVLSPPAAGSESQGSRSGDFREERSWPRWSGPTWPG